MRRACARRCAPHHVSSANSYDDALASVGLSITSYSLLVKIDALGTPSMNELAESAAMDRSTLSRNLKPLLEGKLIAVKSGCRPAAQRVLDYRKRARAALAAAYPKWQDMQVRFRRAYGAGESKALAAMLGRVLTVQA